MAEKVNGLESDINESNEAKPTDEEKKNKGDKTKQLKTKAKQYDAEKKFENRLSHIEKIKEDSKEDLTNLKLNIESFESHFNEKFANIAARVEYDTERYYTWNTATGKARSDGGKSENHPADSWG